MQRRDTRDDPDGERSRAGSRRSSAGGGAPGSAASPRRSGGAGSGARAAAGSTHSSPKHAARAEQLDFLVQGKQIRRTDRAHSLPSSQHRRQSFESLTARSKKSAFEQRLQSSSSRSRETSLEDELSLDLSQVSDFEDSSTKYGVKKHAMKTSTPKALDKPRRSSLQTSPRQCQSRKSHSRESQRDRVVESSFDSCKTYIKESLYESSANTTFQTSAGRPSGGCSGASGVVRPSSTRVSTGITHSPMSSSAEHWSVSPEYSTQSSADTSPRRGSVLYQRPASRLDTPDHRFVTASSSCCVGWSDSERAPLDLPLNPDERRTEGGGEWNHFWANYNNSISTVPMKTYYDQCPTPYRTNQFEITDIEGEDASKKSPSNVERINQIIQKDGLCLTPRETQSLIKCAHILGSVLSKAIDRKAKDDTDRVTEVVEKNEEPDVKDEQRSDVNVDEEKVEKEKEREKEKEKEKEQTENMEKEQRMTERKNLKLELKEHNQPLVKEVKRSEMKTTQTDISLPNTKSAPRIFEKILRQLSKSSLDTPAAKEDDQTEQKPDENT